MVLFRMKGQKRLWPDWVVEFRFSYTEVRWAEEPGGCWDPSTGSGDRE